MYSVGGVKTIAMLFQNMLCTITLPCLDYLLVRVLGDKLYLVSVSIDWYTDPMVRFACACFLLWFK